MQELLPNLKHKRRRRHVLPPLRGGEQIRRLAVLKQQLRALKASVLFEV